MPTVPSRELETVPNPAPGKPYRVRMAAPEFTCLCPRTGQPDFATIIVEYAPREVLIELKSLKLYLWSWRDQRMFHEGAVNQILDDLVAAADPLWMRITGFFAPRGGITTTVAAARGEAPAGMAEFPARPRRLR